MPTGLRPAAQERLGGVADRSLLTLGYVSINLLVIRRLSSPHCKSSAICNHPKNSDIVLADARVFFPFALKGFHVKSVSSLCLIYFVSY
jgi:hypothetical protein